MAEFICNGESIFPEKPNIKELIVRVTETLAYLIRGQLGKDIAEEYLFYMQNGYWDHGLDECGCPHNKRSEDEAEEFHTGLIIKILRGFIYSYTLSPLDLEYISFLEHGRFSNETIADRIYMDSPLFPEDGYVGDYMRLRNIIEVVGILLYDMIPYESADEQYRQMIGTVGASLSDCLKRLRHRSPDMFKWVLCQKWRDYSCLKHICKFMEWNGMEMDLDDLIQTEQLSLIHPEHFEEPAKEKID